MPIQDIWEQDNQRVVDVEKHGSKLYESPVCCSRFWGERFFFVELSVCKGIARRVFGSSGSFQV